MLRFADLTYSDEELEQDAVHYLETQVYEPSYAEKVKEFIAADVADFKRYYDDSDYLFLNVFYDEYRLPQAVPDNDKVPNTDLPRLTAFLEKKMARLDVSDEDIEHYALMLDAEFKKNAYCSHMEPFFSGYDAIAATVLVGYSRNPLFSIYSVAREWCMALHLKNMHPMLVRKFGYRYQEILFNYTGEEKLKRLLDFRDKYKHTFKNIGILRAIHSSVFAYAYLFLKSVQTKEVITAEEFILDSSSSKVTLLLQGESISNFDYPVTKYVLEQFKEGYYKKFFLEDGRIDWEYLYKFTFDAIKNAGFEGMHFFGFDSIEAKTMQAYWNKSSNVQSMLKILRRLALENNNPVFNRLIEGCEYHLGRPDKAKEKMEHFIEDTRRIMAARSFELTKPRTMAQELISAFPSVFLVYFQWHHNFRNIYPKVPKKKVYEEELQINRQKQNMQVKNVLKEQFEQYRISEQTRMADKQKNGSDSDGKLRAILMNKERTIAEMSLDKSQNQRKDEIIKVAEIAGQRQNSY